MFKFDFALDNDEIDTELSSQLNKVHISSASVLPPESAWEEPFVEIPIEELLERLPDVISYSPLAVPVLSSPCTSEQKQTHTQAKVPLVRRDLFDARFQLIAQDDDGLNAPGGSTTDSLSSHIIVNKTNAIQTCRMAGKKTLEFVESPSDLVPGVYEGGLKTWECSLDLAGYLAGNVGELRDVRGKRVLEIGCGTAVPTMYLLHQLLSSPSPAGVKTEFHLQDYNTSVLELVSFPNLILTWYLSPAASAYRTSQALLDGGDSGVDSEARARDPDPTVPGDLYLTPALKAAFLTSLKIHHVYLRFFSGSWHGFDSVRVGRVYDVLLTSETIYSNESLGALLKVLRGAAVVRGGDDRHVCLVAAKILYFGVGGGVEEFVRMVRGEGGEVEDVWDTRDGVGRRIMRVRWPEPLNRD